MGGRKPSGNAFKNPVDSYRKQLGRNEEHQTTMGPRSRGSKHRPTSQRELARARKPPKNWKSIMVWSVVLLVVVGAVFAVVMVDAGKYLFSKYVYGALTGDSAEHVRVHRDR